MISDGISEFLSELLKKCIPTRETRWHMNSFGILLQSNFSNQNFVRGADGSRILTGIPLTFKIFEKMNYLISIFFPPWNLLKSNLLNIFFRVMMEIVLITNPWPVASILFENWVRNLWLSICATLPGKGPSLYYVSTFLDFFWPPGPPTLRQHK